jgi:hypothetical protein
MSPDNEARGAWRVDVRGRDRTMVRCPESCSKGIKRSLWLSLLLSIALSEIGALSATPQGPGCLLSAHGGPVTLQIPEFHG